MLRVLLSTILLFSVAPCANADLLDRIAENGMMVGDFDGLIVPVDLPTHQVSALLPESLKLGEPAKDAKETLVLLVMGQQRDVHFVGKKYLKFRPEDTRQYHEVIIAVPNVYLHEGDVKTGPLTHYARLYLNSERAIELGRKFWGYPKFAAEITSDATSYDVVDPESKAKLLQATFRVEDPQPELRKAAAFADVEKLLSQAVVMRHDDVWMFKEFDWNLAEATLSPANAEVNISTGFWGKIQAKSRQQPLDAKLGSFHMKTRWQTRQIDQPVPTHPTP